MGELTWRERGRLWLRLCLRLGLILLLVLFLGRFGATLWDWISPFFFAGVLAWLLSPLVGFCRNKFGLPRWLWSAGMLLGVLVGLGMLVWSLGAALVGELVSLADEWENTLLALEGISGRLGGLFARWLALLPAGARDTVNGMLEGFFAWLEGAIPGLFSAAMDRAGGIALSLPSFTVAAVVFVMASYFLLTDLPRLREWAADRLPQGVRMFLSIVKRAVTAGFGGYLRAQLLLSLGVFFILLGGFLLIRQPYALLLALWLALLDFIPILGAGTAMVPWAVADLLTGDYRHALGLMAVWALVAVFRRVGEPKILGDQTGLSPLTSLVGVYVGMKMAGVWGMVLGPVVCLVGRNVLRSGVLEHTLGDLRLAWQDIGAILNSGKDDRERAGNH